MCAQALRSAAAQKRKAAPAETPQDAACFRATGKRGSRSLRGAHLGHPTGRNFGDAPRLQAGGRGRLFRGFNSRPTKAESGSFGPSRLSSNSGRGLPRQPGGRRGEGSRVAPPFKRLPLAESAASLSAACPSRGGQSDPKRPPRSPPGPGEGGSRAAPLRTGRRRAEAPATLPNPAAAALALPSPHSPPAESPPPSAPRTGRPLGAPLPPDGPESPAASAYSARPGLPPPPPRAEAAPATSQPAPPRFYPGRAGAFSAPTGARAL